MFQSFLRAYQRASGQLINYTKSQFVASSYATRSALATKGNVLNVQASSLPIKYMCSYLHRGINCARFYVLLLQHFDAKLSGWKRHLLTLGKRLVLIKSVLVSLSLHLIAAAMLPKTMIHAIQQEMANFI